MQHFRTLRSGQSQKSNDLSGELYPDIFSETPPPITKSSDNAPLEASPVLTAEICERYQIKIDQLSPIIGQQPVTTDQLPFTGGQQVVRTDALQPLTRALDIRTTQSLVAALQATITAPQKSLRPPIVIPGKKRSGAAAQDGNQVSRGLHPRLRMGISMSSLLVIMLFSLVALSPLSRADNGAPLLGPITQWVHYQQQNLGSFTAHVMQTDQAKTTTTTTTTTTLPDMTLPTSQYVAIAQQDAAAAGIPSDYFVRQIMTESGFNPNAVSPAGAVGIAQFLPSTAASLGFNPYDPIAALKGAAQYMASLYNQYGQDYAKALAAYNAGSGAVDSAVQQGGANWMNYLPAETQNYIYKIMGI